MRDRRVPGLRPLLIGAFLWIPTLDPMQGRAEDATLAGGVAQVLVIREGGQLWGMGTNQSAALEVPQREMNFHTNLLSPYRLGGESDWVAVEAMGDAQGTCFALRKDALLQDPRLWAWGENSAGQLGNGTLANQKIPVLTGNGWRWKSVSARGGSVFAIRSDGTLWAWGKNEGGTGALGIGRGRGAIQNLPVQVGSSGDWQSVQASLGSAITLTNSNGVSTLTAGRGGAGIRGNDEIWAWGTTFAKLVTTNGSGSSNGLVYAVSTNFTPKRVGTESGWKQIVFAQSAYALKRDGSLWQFNNDKGSFDPFPSATNNNRLNWKVLRGIQTGEGTNATGHVLGIKTDGTLWAWGDNSRGQVSDKLSRESPQDEPWPITEIDDLPDDGWAEIGVGPNFSLAVTRDGVLYFWGSPVMPLAGTQRQPVKLDGIQWKNILAGSDFSLGADSDGKLFAWGATDLPLTNQMTRYTPEPIDGGLSSAESGWEGNFGWTRGLAVAGRQVLAMNASGGLRIWGDSDSPNPSLPWWNPVRTEGTVQDLGSGWQSLAANRGLARLPSGANSPGSNDPVGMVGALRLDGTLWTWGTNDVGQLGDGTKLSRDRPQRVGNDTNWDGVEVGGAHVLAWKKDGSLWGWGANSNGELGLTTQQVVTSNNYSGGTNGTNATNRAGDTNSGKTSQKYTGRVRTTTIGLASNVSRPTLVLNKGWGVMQVSAGASHTLVLNKNRTLWSMGADDAGQLGLGRPVRPESSTNTNVSGTNSNNASNGVRTWTRTNVVTNIRVAPYRVETNVDTVIDRGTMFQPQRVGRERWQSVSAGGRHSLGVRMDGTLWAWGDNSFGQLGIGNLISTQIPTQVGAGNRWDRVFAGQKHSLALQRDGSLWTWGLHDGRLGIPVLEDSNLPPREVSFGFVGLATLLIEPAWGGSQISGSGLVAFDPRGGSAKLCLQLSGSEWSGSGGYQANQGSLKFSSLTLAPSSATGASSSEAGATDSASRFQLGELKSSWFWPGEFRGSAALDGRACRAILLLAGDADRDGIPDLVDSSPWGAPPKLPSPLTLSRKLGTKFDFQLPLPDSSCYPILSPDLSDLPPDLYYEGNWIRGSVTNRNQIGTHPVVVGAGNLSGETYRTLQIEVLPADPSLDEPDRLVWIQGRQPFSHTLQMRDPAAPGYPYSFEARNLPGGLALERNTGAIRPFLPNSKGPPEPGLYAVSIRVTHPGGGLGTGVWLLESRPGPEGQWMVGTPLKFQIKLGGKGKTTLQTALPAGLQYDPAKGLISGTPLEAGEFPMAATQQGGVGEPMNTFTLSIQPSVASRNSVDKLLSGSASHGLSGWSAPAIFSAGPLSEFRVETSGQLARRAGNPALGYALSWTNTDGWKWDESAGEESTRLTLTETALRRSQRWEVLKKQTNALRLAGISYASAATGTYSSNSMFWLRSVEGQKLPRGSAPGACLLDFSQTNYVQWISQRVKYLVESGCVDGVYLPEWDEADLWPKEAQPALGVPGGPTLAARLALLKNLRTAVGSKGWIFAETTGNTWTATGYLIDGVHLVAATEPPPQWPPAEAWNPEPYSVRDPGGKNAWQKMEEALVWFGTGGTLRKPGTVALELWSRYGKADPRNLPTRCTGLALSLCLSDGAYLFAEPDWWQENGKPIRAGEHLWYAEWDRVLGQAVESRQTLPNEQGVYMREFENGWAAYAPADRSDFRTLTFARPVTSLKGGQKADRHQLAPGTGDIYYLPKE